MASQCKYMLLEEFQALEIKKERNMADYALHKKCNQLHELLVLDPSCIGQDKPCLRNFMIQITCSSQDYLSVTAFTSTA
jgi:hypothetical protein